MAKNGLFGISAEEGRDDINTQIKGGEKMKSQTKRIVIPAILIGFVLLSVMVALAAATTWYVHEGESIQDAINGASDGDTVFVYNGTYVLSGGTFGIWLDKANLTLKGEGADAVTIDGNGGDILIDIGIDGSSAVSAPGCVLDGFTIKNGSTGVAVCDEKSPNCIVRNNVLDGCSVGSGASNTTIIDNKVLNPTSSNGGIIVEGSDCTVINNVILNAKAKYCAMRAYRITSCTIDNNTIINATGELKYGGLYIRGDSFKITNNTFIGCANRAITLRKPETANNIITRNNISSNGGIICLNDAGEGNKIYLNDFVDNTKNVTYSGTIRAQIWNSTEQIEYVYDSYEGEDYLGNYWSPDYTGTDTDGDGIGDTPYDIPGSTDKDYRPLMMGFENYLGEAQEPEPNATVYLVPENSSAAHGNEVEVELWTNTSDPYLAGGQINLTYNPDCANVTNFVRDAAWGMGAWNSNTDGKEWITFVSDTPKTGEVLIGTLTVHCVNESMGNCTTGLVFDEDSKLFTPLEEIETAWEDGSFACANVPVPEQPDLVIVEKTEDWVSLADKTYDVTYTVKNAGDAEAGASNTTITIDDVDVPEDPVPALAAGASDTNTVGPFTMSGASDTIKVCADNGEVVAESNETNNCMENVFAVPAEYTIKIGNYTINLFDGGEVTVPVEIWNATDVEGGEANVTFNSSVVGVKAVSAGNFGTPEANIDNTNGFVHIAASSATAAGVDPAVLAYVVFEGLAEGETDLEIDDAYVSFDAGNTSIPAATEDGHITVETLMRGDLNRNDRLDTGDATLVLRMVVGLTPVDMLGDMNQNGRIDTGDATIILRIIVGLPVP